jgi:hypothetical protein
MAAGIYVTHMLDDFRLSRDDLKFLPDLGAHFVQRIAATRTDLLFGGQTVFYDLNRQVLRLDRTMPLLLLAAIVDFLDGRFCYRRLSLYFRLVKTVAAAPSRSVRWKIRIAGVC